MKNLEALVFGGFVGDALFYLQLPHRFIPR